jgi:hypothetical protein
MKDIDEEIKRYEYKGLTDDIVDTPSLNDLHYYLLSI